MSEESRAAKGRVGNKVGGKTLCGCIEDGKPCAKACGLSMVGWLCEEESGLRQEYSAAAKIQPAAPPVAEEAAARLTDELLPPLKLMETIIHELKRYGMTEERPASIGVYNDYPWSPVPEFAAAIRLLPSELESIRAALQRTTPSPTREAEVEKRLKRAEGARDHTQKWYASHYGKLEDWARKNLPEPWRNEFFSCIANGTYSHKDVGPEYVCNAGFRVVPSGYIHMDDAKGQLVVDQTRRAEEAELELATVKARLAQLELELDTCRRQGRPHP